MRHHFDVSLSPSRREVDDVCTNCHEYKRTTAFEIQVACRLHQKQHSYPAHLCKDCLEAMEDSEEGGFLFQICTECVKDMLKFKPSSVVPNFMPEDI